MCTYEMERCRPLDGSYGHQMASSHTRGGGNLHPIYNTVYQSPNNSSWGKNDD